MTKNGLFLAAVAAIAIHVIDDSFVQPNPGTSAGDHLISGLVPLALLATSAWAYRRGRPGTQAAIALALVIPAGISGVEAVHYSGDGGMSGDDYTGLLAMAAAPLLLGLGIHSLWTSRRLGDRLAWRYGRRSLRALGGAAVALLVILPMGVSYIGSHAARGAVPEADLGAAHEDVTLHTSDGLDLKGWYVPSKNGAAVITFPGRKGPMKHAKMLARHGYGVLLFDRRGEGASDGDPDGFGWDFDKDIEAAIDFLEGRPEVDDGRIGGLGLSVGGEQMLQTASQTDGLDAVVSEGAGARTMAEEIYAVDGFSKFTTALTYASRDFANVVSQGRTPPENLKNLVPKIDAPIFFIHAGADDVGMLGPKYYDVATAPKQIWEAAGGHTDGIDDQPEEYERRVTAFFDRYLLGAN